MKVITNNILVLFGIDGKNSSIISRLLKDSLAAGVIKLQDENSADKNRRYVPYWA